MTFGLKREREICQRRCLLYILALASSLAQASAGETSAERSKLLDRQENVSATEEGRSQCYEHPSIRYNLKWQASGERFFDLFHFVEADGNNGATEFLTFEEAKRERVVEAFPGYAIMRAGRRSTSKRMKRTSAKIFSRSYWNYFLAAVRFTHVPYGCGVWPAFWTHAPGSVWPEGGELDILEYVNDLPGKTSLHTGKRNPCKLTVEDVAPPGCTPMPDLNGMDYDCHTDYPGKLGCAPNRLPTHPGNVWASKPGVMAAEWTPHFVKVFYIPEADLYKAGLHEGGTPRPDDWDEYIMSYYPFHASHERANACPKPSQVLWPQQLVFQTAFCGDWAGKVWEASASCANVVGPSIPGECRTVDPMDPTFSESDLEQDCCSKYVFDENSEYGTDDHFQNTAYWNFTWIKVWQWEGWYRRLEEFV